MVTMVDSWWHEAIYSPPKKTQYFVRWKNQSFSVLRISFPSITKSDHLGLGEFKPGFFRESFDWNLEVPSLAIWRFMDLSSSKGFFFLLINSVLGWSVRFEVTKLLTPHHWSSFGGAICLLRNVSLVALALLPIVLASNSVIGGGFIWANQRLREWAKKGCRENIGYRTTGNPPCEKKGNIIYT